MIKASKTIGSSLLLLVLGMPKLHAQRNWSGNASDNHWGSDSNWTGGGSPNSTTIDVTFDDSASGRFSISMQDRTRDVRNLNFSLVGGSNRTYHFYNKPSGTGEIELNGNLTMNASGDTVRFTNYHVNDSPGDDNHTYLDVKSASTWTNNGGNLIFDNGLRGSAGVTMNGNVTFNAVNSYTGNFTVSSGVTTLGHSEAFKNGKITLNVDDGISLSSASDVFIGGLAGSGDLDIGSRNIEFGLSSTHGYAGDLDGSVSSSITYLGSGQQTLSGAVRGFNDLDVTGGKFRFNGNTVTLGGSSTITLNGGDLELLGGAGLTLSATSLANGSNLNVGSDTLTLNNGSLTVAKLSGNSDGVIDLSGTGTNLLTFGEVADTGATFSFDGLFTGSNGTIKKVGDGDVTMNGVSGFGGTVEIEEGSLIWGSNRAFQNATLNLLVDDGFDFNDKASITLGALAGSGDIDLDDNTFIFGGNDSDTEYSGDLTGIAGNRIRKIGTGIFELDGGSHVLGNIEFNEGSSVVNGGSIAAANVLRVGKGDTGAATIQEGADVDVTGRLVLGTDSGNGTLTVTGSSTTVDAAGINLGELNHIETDGEGHLVIQDGATVVAPGALDYFSTDSSVTVNGGSLTVGSISSDTGTLILTADPAGGTAFTIGGDNSDTTFNSIITGGGSIQKTGTGDLILGAANTFSGVMDVDAGRVVLNDGDALQNASVDIGVDGGLDINGQSVVYLGNLAGSGALEIGTSEIRFGFDDQDTIFSGNITQDGAGGSRFIKNGTGTFLLNGGMHSFGNVAFNGDGGTTTIDGSSMTVANTLRIGNTNDGSTIAQNGADIDVSGLLAVGTYGGESTFTVTGAATMVNSSGIKLGELNHIETGGIGHLVVENGSTVNSSGALFFRTSDSSVTVDGGSLEVDNISTTVGSIELSNSAGSGNLVLSGGSSSSFAGLISDGAGGGGTLIKNGAGTSLTLSGSNTFSGTVGVNAGSLVLGSSTTVQNATVQINTDNGLDLNSQSNPVIGGLAGSGDLTLGSLNLTSGGNNADTSYSGDLTGSAMGRFVHEGSGTLTISGGTHNLGRFSGTDGLVIMDNVNMTTTNGTLASGSGLVQSWNNGEFGIYENGEVRLLNGSKVSLTGAFGGVQGDSNTSGGILRLNGAGTEFDGGQRFTVARGVGRFGLLHLQDNASMKTSAHLVVGWSGQGNLIVQSGSDVSTSSLMLGRTSSGVGVVSCSGIGTTLDANHVFIGGENAGAQGGTGTVQINDGASASVSNSFHFLKTGTALVADGGSVTAGGLSEFSGEAGLISISDPTGGTALTVGNASDYTYSGIIRNASSGAGSIVKQGTGDLELTGNTNTFSGGVTVTGGNLIVNNTSGSATGSGEVTLQSGTTLSGTGTISGAVIATDATVSPGNSVGTLNLGSDLELDGTLVIELDETGEDRISVTGELDISDCELDFQTTETLTDSAYKIADYGTLVGTFSSVSNVPANYRVDYDYDDGIDSNNIALVLMTKFEQWAVSQRLDPGTNGAPDQDPNGDGKPNLHHFALNTDPLGDGSDEGKRLTWLVEDTEEEYLTLTLPVLNGATFSGTDELSATVDGIVYVIQGSLDLGVDWAEEIEEVTPALDSGLPALGDFDGEEGADWQYHTFRIKFPVSASHSAFIRAGFTESQP